jgi:hypothetical protein
MTSTRTAKSKSSSGSILVEAVLCLPPICLALFLGLEIARLARLEVVLHHTAFLAARFAALGRSGGEADREIHTFLARIYGERGARELQSKLRISISPLGKRWVAKAYYRYRMFQPFTVRRPEGREIYRHHLEMTQSCIFSW